MKEGKTDNRIPELVDEALDAVAGGKEKVINGRQVRVCDRCEKPLPHWYEGALCEECRKNPIG